MSGTNANTPKRNSIKSTEHGVKVVLDPAYMITNAAYIPNGEEIVKSEMTIGQLIEGIALAHIRAKMPHLVSSCQCATITYAEGRFEIHFADSAENLF